MIDSLTQLEHDCVQCRACPRLVTHRETTAREKRRAYRDQSYWGRPVPGWGDPSARVVFVGLAPGAHGSNRTGRPFTGDASGDFLYPALHRAGLASHAIASHVDDGLNLIDCWITAAVRCAPPDNKPTREEFARCRPFLVREIDLLPRARVFVALGRLAMDSLLSVLPPRFGTLAPERPMFRHGGEIQVGNQAWIVTSYHPSRQNTQTGRLTVEMFDAMLHQVLRLGR